jgi:hypothetical protein
VDWAGFFLDWVTLMVLTLDEEELDIFLDDDGLPFIFIYLATEILDELLDDIRLMVAVCFFGPGFLDWERDAVVSLALAVDCLEVLLTGEVDLILALSRALASARVYF